MNSTILLSKALFQSFLRFIVFILPALAISALFAAIWYFAHPYLLILEHQTADLLNAGFWLVYVLLATLAMGNAMEKIQKMQGSINKAGELLNPPEEVKKVESEEQKTARLREAKRQEEQFFSLMKTPIQPVILH